MLKCHFIAILIFPVYRTLKLASKGLIFIQSTIRARITETPYTCTRNKNGTVIGFLLQRIEFNKDYFVTNIMDIHRHDVEYTTGANCFKELDNLVLGVEAAFSYNFNRYYIERNDKTNFYIGLNTQIKLQQ